MLLIVLFLIITVYVLCSVLCLVCVLCRISRNKKAQLKGNNYYTVWRLHAHLRYSRLKSAWKLFTHPFCLNKVGRNRILPSKEKKAAYCHANHLDHSVSCGGSTETVRRNHLSLLEKEHQEKSSLTHQMHLNSWTQRLGNKVVKHSVFNPNRFLDYSSGKLVERKGAV